MKPHYIIGFDGSPSARAALSFARSIARVTDAALTAVYVYPNVAYVPAAGVGAALTMTDLTLLEDLENAAKTTLREAGDDVRQLTVAGSSPPRELHAIAKSESADLIVLGATHRGAAGRIIPGSVGERVLHGAPCPVVVVPSDAALRPMATVAVAYDGQLESRRALRAAEGLAKRTGASLLLVGVMDEAVVESELRTALDAAARGMRGQGLEVEVSLTAGVAAYQIADACRDGVDLLITGSRGYGPLRAVIVGATTRHLVDHAPCPVMVVPRAVSGAVAEEPTSLSAV